MIEERFKLFLNNLNGTPIALERRFHGVPWFNRRGMIYGQNLDRR